ncbi:uncoupling protein 2-like isoform X1 [Gracilaria domingensis]|nr:uncoupling protein 2-like isoform X1 [Gracilaria domingensis]
MFGATANLQNGDNRPKNHRAQDFSHGRSQPTRHRQAAPPAPTGFSGSALQGALGSALQTQPPIGKEHLSCGTALTEMTADDPQSDTKRVVVQSLQSFWNTVQGSVKDGTLPNVAVARLASVLLLHPLDTFKSRLQQTSAKSVRAIGAYARNAPPFSGLPAAILGQIPYTAVSLALFLHLKDRLTQVPERRRMITAALISDSVAALWLTPFESIKLRVQTSVQPCVRTAFQSGGLYSGLNAQLLRDVPYRGAHLALLTALAIRQKRRDVRGTLGSACIAAAVGMVTTPLDVVRTRVMAQKANSVARVYSGALNCASKVMKTEGFVALFKGAVPRGVYMGVSVLVFSAAFTTAERFEGKFWKKSGVIVSGSGKKSAK